jgi:hypothetical protein
LARSLGITPPQILRRWRDILPRRKGSNCGNLHLPGLELIDDHALNAIGIPTLDIIDFDYPRWQQPMTQWIKSAPKVFTPGPSPYYLSELLGS